MFKGKKANDDLNIRMGNIEARLERLEAAIGKSKVVQEEMPSGDAKTVAKHVNALYVAAGLGGVDNDN